MDQNRIQMVTSFWHSLNKRARVCPSCDARLQAHINEAHVADTMQRNQASTNQSTRLYTILEQEDDKKQPESHLLTLPGELRNRIYEYALSDHTNLSIDNVSLMRVLFTKHFQFPNMLEVSRQTRREAMSIWLSTAMFWFNFHGELFEFLRMMGPERCKMIGRLRESYWWQNRAQAECSLKQIGKGLEDFGLESVKKGAVVVQFHGVKEVGEEDIVVLRGE